MYCPNCGKKTIPGARYCGECGTKIEITIEFIEGKTNYFEVKRADGKKNSFFISGNKLGDKWLELWAYEDDYDALADYIINLPDVEIIENDARLRQLKYIRNDHEFGIDFVECVDPWIDPHWDGDPFIEFTFVATDHSWFNVYAYEAIELCEKLEEIWKNKRERCKTCKKNTLVNDGFSYINCETCEDVMKRFKEYREQNKK